MSKTEGMQFRSFVPLMVASLEDADGAVRQAAKAAVIELFKNAPENAKADLKKQLVKHNVRKSIADDIVSQMTTNSTPEVDLQASTISIPLHPSESTADHGLADSLMSEQPPPQEAVSMDPLYVHTQRELDDMFREMLPHFEGRETEQNWMARDKSITKLRRLLKGNAPTEFQASFIAGVKSMRDPILKLANTLRTTASSNGCQLVQELAKTLGPAIDPMVEIFLQNFIKMTAATKHIASQNGNATVEAIFSNVSYHKSLMEHIDRAFSEKNVQTRTCAPGWMKLLLQRHAHHKAQIEHTGGLEIAEKCIKRGLSDPKPKVKEDTRGTYWVYARIWPVRAEA